MDAVTTFVPKTQVVAAVQFEPRLLQPRQNLEAALQLTFEALGKGAKLVVLPECCIGGAVLRTQGEAFKVCQEKDGWQTEAFVPLARQFGAHVVFGYTEWCEGKFYNSAAMVGPAGLAGNWQKHNLYGSDHLIYQPSEQQPFTVLTGAGRTGVLVCRDACNRYRESYYAYQPGKKFYKKGDVDTLCLLTNWGSSFSYPDSAWVQLVEETRANVIVSNRVGVERDMSYKGGSAVIDRDRRIWTNGSSFTEAAVVGGVVVL
jgi:N-carbamoylputrescine amidase